MRTAFAAAFLIVILALSCAYCTMPPPQQPVLQEPTTVARLGGPNWRVMDADLVDTIEAIPMLRQIHADVEACSGVTRPYEDMRVFLATEIHVRRDTVWVGTAHGTWRNGNWVYVRRGLTPYWTGWTLKHEIVHYVTQLAHPEVEAAMKACGVHYEISQEKP